MYLKLKEMWPEAVPYYGGDGHVLTMLYGRLWDSKGVQFYPLRAEPRIYEEAFNWRSQKTNDKL